jgi:hypothetical protein
MPRARTFAPLLLLGIAAVMAGCPLPSPPPPPIPVAQTSADPSCDTCYTTKLDNPVVNGSIKLETFEAQTIDGLSTTIAESVDYESGGVVWGDMWPRMTVTGDNDTQGSFTRGATNALPFFPASMGMTAAPASVSVEVYGLEMGYDFATIDGQNLNGFGNLGTSVPVFNPAIKLDPTVMLVPMQVIRVLPGVQLGPNGPMVFNANDPLAYLAQVSPRDYKRWFDDVPVVNLTSASTNRPTMSGRSAVSSFG